MASPRAVALRCCLPDTPGGERRLAIVAVAEMRPVIRHLTRRLATHYRCRNKALVGCTWRRAIRESKAQRLWPRPKPRMPAFRRSALSVRFIFLAISGRGVRAFECALSSRTSSLVHGVRWAEVFFFGTDCCSGKGSRLRATPVARLTHASKRGPRLRFSTGRPNFLLTLTS